MKDNKKKFTGKELGIIVLDNVKRIFEDQEPLYSKEEIIILENSLSDKRNIDKFKEYKIIAENIEDLLYITNHTISEAHRRILMLTDIIKEEFIKLRLSYYEQLLPILVTPKQYDDVESKKDLKDIKISADTLLDLGAPVYSKDVDYEPTEIAVVTNPSKKNIDGVGYYKQQRADEYFDKNIAFHNKYEDVGERCKWLIKAVGKNLKDMFAYYELAKLMSDNVNVDFTSVIDKHIEELNLHIPLYNFYLKSTIKFKKIISEIDMTKFKPPGTRMARANKEINKAKSLKDIDWQKVFEVLAGKKIKI